MIVGNYPIILPFRFKACFMAFWWSKKVRDIKVIDQEAALREKGNRTGNGTVRKGCNLG